MKVGIFTRMSYDEPISKSRMNLYHNYLKSLKSQIYKDFDVYIITSGGRKKVGTPENTELIKSQDTGDLNISYVSTAEIPKNKYNLQIRLDSDDYIFPSFVLKCIEAYVTTDKDEFVIVFQPYVYNALLKKLYKQGRRHQSGPSAFQCLCQKRNISKFVYNYDHSAIQHHIENVLYVPTELCFFSIHLENESSTLQPNDLYLCDVDLE